VVTPTASGKTLCYNLPVLDTVLKEPDARALYLFPTKALAQDQLAEMHSFVEALGVDIGAFTYDGDTPGDARKAIRSRAHVVVTNPDMLHKGILPHHTKWVKLFENLRYVVVDELHGHRGVYGSHVANIFRRLRRLCRFYGSDPQFLCSSATIGNPKELAETLTGKPMTLVDRSGAPRGERYFAIYNPPVVNRPLGIRRSALNCARDVALSFLEKGLQTIVFAPSRLSTEILVTYLKEALETRPGSEGVVRGYRGGYLPLKRREIERGLREGAAGGRLHQRPRAGHRHRRPRRRGAPRLSGQRGLGVAAGGPGRPPLEHVGRGARRELHAPEPVHRPPSRLLLRVAGGAGTHQPRQPADPREPREVRGLRAALRGRRDVRARGCAGGAGLPGGGASRPSGGRAVALDERELSRRRRQPAQRVLGQRRGPGRHLRPGINAEVDLDSAPAMLHEKAVYSEGKPTSSRSTITASAGAHAAEVDYYTDAITYTKVRSSSVFR
jgi:hypothetical protein